MATQAKLAVLLHADVVGSSALVQRDERVAHDQIQGAFKKLALSVEAYGGVTHEIRGDALVAEFPRTSDAVCAAVAFQSTATEGALPQVRIGISMGEVVIADHTVTGLGIVLAQRIEQLAKSGGVSVQGAAYETIPRRLPFIYENLGEQVLKGVDEPIRVFLCELRPGSEVPAPDVAIEGEPGAAPLADKPTVAVLPFDNMSGDPEQDYFAEGISEDITTELSRFRSIFVISRHSSFTYRGRTDDIKTIGEELGVRYVLEGSVRKAGNRVRVTAQLTDAHSGGHIWADRYDRDLEDIFEIQDEITSTVCSTLAGRLQRVETQRAKAKITELTAYDYLLRGLDLHKSGNITEDTAKRAVELFAKAIDADPGLARGYAWLACSSSRLWPEGWNDSHLDGALETVQRALDLDPDESEAHRIAGACYFGKGQYDKADFHISRALELNPNDAHITIKAADYFAYVGHAEKAQELVSRAMRLNPHHPAWYWQTAGLAHYVAREYADAIRDFGRNTEPAIFDYAYLAASYSALGHLEAANEQIAEMRALRPSVSLDYFRVTYPYTAYKDTELAERFLWDLGRTDLAS